MPGRNIFTIACIPLHKLLILKGNRSLRITFSWTAYCRDSESNIFTYMHYERNPNIIKSLLHPNDGRKICLQTGPG